MSHEFWKEELESDLYFSIKRAEKVAEYFKSTKASMPKESCEQGCGSDFPLAKEMK